MWHVYVAYIQFILYIHIHYSLQGEQPDSQVKTMIKELGFQHYAYFEAPDGDPEKVARLILFLYSYPSITVIVF